MAPKRKHIIVDVAAALVAAGITDRELSEATGIARTTLRRKLRRPGTLTIDEYAAIAERIDLPAFEVAS